MWAWVSHSIPNGPTHITPELMVCASSVGETVDSALPGGAAPVDKSGAGRGSELALAWCGSREVQTEGDLTEQHVENSEVLNFVFTPSGE
jgi:hypothetical protein